MRVATEIDGSDWATSRPSSFDVGFAGHGMNLDRNHLQPWPLEFSLQDQATLRLIHIRTDLTLQIRATVLHPPQGYSNALDDLKYDLGFKRHVWHIIHFTSLRHTADELYAAKGHTRRER